MRWALPMCEWNLCHCIGTNHEYNLLDKFLVLGIIVFGNHELSIIIPIVLGNYHNWIGKRIPEAFFIFFGMEWWFNFDLICWSSMSIVSGHSFAAFNLDVYRHWSQGNQLQWLSLSFIDYQFPLLQTTQHMLYIYIYIHAYSTFEYYILILSIEISLDLVLYYSAILILYLVLYCLLILFMFPESPCRRLSRKRPRRRRRRRCRRRQRQLRGRGRRRRMRSAWRLQRRRPVEREVGDLGMDQYLLYHF